VEHTLTSLLVLITLGVHRDIIAYLKELAGQNPDSVTGSPQ